MFFSFFVKHYLFTSNLTYSLGCIPFSISRRWQTNNKTNGWVTKKACLKSKIFGQWNLTELKVCYFCIHWSNSICDWSHSYINIIWKIVLRGWRFKKHCLGLIKKFFRPKFLWELPLPPLLTLTHLHTYTGTLVLSHTHVPKRQRP